MGPHPSGERRSQPGGATAAQRALIELADAAAPGASLSQVLEGVARAAATLVPGSLVHVWLASEDQRELKRVTEIGARPDHGGAEQCRAVPMDESLLGAVVQSPEPVVVPSLLDDERAVSRAWAQHQSVVSFAGVRLARGDRPLGALCLLTWEPYSFTPLEVSFLRSLGAHAAVAIEAVALLEVASTRRRRLETLREIEGGLSAQRDPDALMATISRRAAELPAAEREFLETLAAHAAVGLENAIENARLYDATRHQVEQLERLNHVNRAVSASLRLDDVLDEMTRAAGMLCDAPLATVWLADETERILVRRAFHGAREIREQLPDRLAFGQGGVGVVAERREVQLNVPVEANPQIVARETLLAHGVRTFSGLPVMLGDRLLGVLAVSGRVGRLHGPADEALLEALVGQAAVAIQNARLYEEARAHEVEAQRALDELRRTQEQLVRAEKLRALGDMASGVAHDFNNVLAVILGRVQLLQRKVEDSTFRRWLAIVEQAALDGAQTVRQIQEFTRVRRDQPTQTVDLNQAARDAVEATRARWRDESHARGVEILLALELGAVPPVDGQPLELREVVTNLMLNAVDALPRGGQIRIVTREHAGRVEMSVADTGMGMSDAVRRRIFEPFFSTKGPRGTGLGLAMVYGIVSRHGGEVLVNTTEGVGSTFTIRLPVGRLPPSDVARASALGPASARVLLIDDEPFVRETLEEILRLQQHDVVVADDGISGLARFREGAFDLVMTDLAMPGMSGWQVAQAVKAARPQVPVVLVTGWGVEVQADDLKKHGVDRVLTKPFRFDDVRDVLTGVRSA